MQVVVFLFSMLAMLPGFPPFGGCATWQIPTGAAIKTEKHKTKNASYKRQLLG